MKTGTLQLLRDAGYISALDVSLLTPYIETWKTTPYKALTRTHILSEFSLADAFAEVLKIDHILKVEKSVVDIRLFEKWSYFDALNCEALPLYREESGSILVLVSDPTDHVTAGKLKTAFGFDIKHCVAERRVVLAAIDANYPIEAQMPVLSQQQ